MAQTIELYEACPICGGDGIRTSTGSNDGTPYETSTQCNSCAGTGSHLNGTIVLDPGIDDVMDKLNDVMDKLNDIMEKLNEA